MTDTTTFTDDNLRAQIDAWLYETSIKCLQHLVDLFLQFHAVLQPLLNRLFTLLVGFVQRAHQSLASMAIAALVRFVRRAAEEMTQDIWNAALDVLHSTSRLTRPSVVELVTPPKRLRPASEKKQDNSKRTRDMKCNALYHTRSCYRSCQSIVDSTSGSGIPTTV